MTLIKQILSRKFNSQKNKRLSLIKHLQFNLSLLIFLQSLKA